MATMSRPQVRERVRPGGGHRRGYRPAGPGVDGQRYLDGEALAGYLKAIEGSRIVTIRMRPQRWNSTDQS